MRYVKWFASQTSGLKANMAVRIVAGVAQVGCGLLLVVLCRHFIDRGIWQAGVAKEIMAIFAVLVVSILLRQAVYYLQNDAEVRQQNTIRSRLYGILLGRRLFDKRERMHSGDISQRLERDIQAVSQVTTDVVPRMAVTVVQLIGAFLLLHAMDKVLAWSLLLLTPFVAVCAKYLSHRLRQMTLDIRSKESSIQMLIQETMENETAIKSMESAPWLGKRLASLHADLGRLVRRRTRFTMLSRLLLASTFGLGYMGAFVYGGLQLRDGLISFGVMTAFLQLVSQIQSPVLAMLNMIPQIIHATASIDRIREIETMPMENETETTTALQGPIGIRVEHAYYRYKDNGKTVLEDFSYCFTPGSSTAIMGDSGRGKTTVLRLLSAVAMPDAGSVYIYDGEGHKLSGAAMRHYITYIPQGNTMMSGTIRENMLLANPDATRQQMEEALYTAAADFVEKMPQGIDTQIGEHATLLSEGQAQRLAIARGLLHGGEVMLLDEISSSLDEATEATLISRLFSRHSEKTIIFVTHRKATAEKCDRVIRI